MMTHGQVEKDSRRGLRGYQGFFLALTLVVMVVIVFLSENLTSAVLIIGLITNFLIISSQLTMMGDRHFTGMGPPVMVNPGPAVLGGGVGLMANFEGFASRPDAGRREGYTPGVTTAPPGAPPPRWTTVPEHPAPKTYPGAIDLDDEGAAPAAPALGHSDWDEGGRDSVPVGNPHNISRVAAPQAAEPCVDDDAIAVYDGDELNAYQARSRNDPERVWAGIHRRKALVERYVGEELDEVQDTIWWGRHET